jgi:hypothetical protein
MQGPDDGSSASSWRLASTPLFIRGGQEEDRNIPDAELSYRGGTPFGKPQVYRDNLPCNEDACQNNCLLPQLSSCNERATHP